MKVLLISQYFYPKIGGLETSLESISQGMKAAGIEVEILTSRFDKSLATREERDEMVINRYPFIDNLITRALPYIKVFFARRGFKKYIKNMEYDLIITRDPISMYACSIYKDAKILYLPGSVVEHEYLYEKYNGFMGKIYDISKKQYIKIQKKAFEKADILMCYSENFKEEIIDYCRDLKISKVNVNHPGVNKKFTPLAEINSNYYEQYNLKPDDTVFLYLGRLEPQKKVDLIIESFNNIEYKDKKLLIVGTGGEEKKLKQLVEQLNLQQQVIFVGKTHEQQVFYNISDYMITASEYEPFGFVIIESLACGTPVIGIKRSYPEIKVAYDEIVMDNEHGFVIPSCNVQSMSEVLNKAVNIKQNHPELYKKMSQSGIKRVEECYNWENFVSKLIVIYNESVQ